MEDKAIEQLHKFKMYPIQNIWKKVKMLVI